MKEFRAQGSQSPPVIRQWAVRRPLQLRRILMYAAAVYCSLVVGLALVIAFLVT